MARRITYKFNNQPREINFAKDKYRDMYHAIAAAEGIDLTNYLKMEQQVEMTTKGSAAVRNFRDQEFARMGFSDVYFIKE